MNRPFINAELPRPFSGRVPAVVVSKDRTCNAGKSVTRPAADGFPPRPDARLLSEVIPLFFIGRNVRGLWLAREADGRIGGLFLFRRSALRFAARNGAAGGCATMLLGQRFELGVENRGGWFAAALDAAMRKLAPKMPKLVASRRS